jgi:hypothetical protein
MNLVRGFVERPSKEKIVMPFGAVLAPEGPQQQYWQKNRFQEPSPVRAAHVQALARWTATQQIESSL